MSLKHDLLYELEFNRDIYLSGQRIAEKLGVSRNAVWKAVNALKLDGYEIESGSKKGYRLAEGSDLLSAEGIKRYLSNEAGECSVFTYREIDSTNNAAKRMLADGFRDFAVVASEYQSEGRGRHGRSFYSPSRSGIYMTLILHPESALSDTVLITIAAAVAVVRTIESLTDKRPMIKWVNDIYLDGKKICGILTEAVTDLESETVHSVIVGIGINIHTMSFPEDIRDIAVSLKPNGVTRNQIIAEIANQLFPLARNLAEKTYLQEYRTHSLILGRKINYSHNHTVCRGVAVGMDDSGGLIVQNEDGSIHVLRSGEVGLQLV